MKENTVLETDIWKSALPSLRHQGSRRFEGKDHEVEQPLVTECWRHLLQPPAEGGLCRSSFIVPGLPDAGSCLGKTLPWWG